MDLQVPRIYSIVSKVNLYGSIIELYGTRIVLYWAKIGLNVL